MPIAVGVHPFPSRTRQLSPLAPKILGWKRPGKIGRRRLFLLPPDSSGGFLFPSYNRIRERRCVPVSCCYALAGREQREAVCPTKSSLCGWNWRLKQKKHHFWYNDDVQAVKKKERCCSLVNRDLPSTVPKTPSPRLIFLYPVPGGFFLVSFP